MRNRSRTTCRSGRGSRIAILVGALALVLAACPADEPEVEDPNDTEEVDPEDENDEAADAPECEEEQEIVFAFITPAGSPYDAGGEAFADYLEENAPGCFDFQSFPGGELGDELDILQSIQAGAVQLGVGAFAFGGLVREAPVLMTPFVFEDREHNYEAVDGQVGEEFREYTEPAGFKTLGYFTAGDRHILSTQPVEAEEDLQGLSMRVAPDDVQIAVWRAVGLNPVDLPFGDMYTGLQTGTVDAIELDPALIVQMSLYEVTDYYILTDHLTGAYPLVMDLNFYESLDPELQTIIDEAGQAGQEANRARDEELIEDSLRALEEDHGIEIVEFDNEQLRQEVQDTYDEFPERLPPDLLEQILQIRQ
jgi:tripartite ATP-independent transporter DctP family solute receptor